MQMTMNYELITPEWASNMLESCNENNRKISSITVDGYASDIVNNNWDETVGSAISIDCNGMLRDGQHRLSAVVKAGIPVHMWVCRNVSADGIYDSNRKRSNSDQVTIMRPDLENVYRSTRYISIARYLISGRTGSRVTAKTIIDWTDEHKEMLDGFFLNFPQTTYAKISLAPVHCALFMAYTNNVSIDDILDFYDVLTSGMSVDEKFFPVIAFRNFLLVSNGTPAIELIARTQYALKKYLTGSCAKRNVAPNEYIYKSIFKEEK